MKNFIDEFRELALYLSERASARRDTVIYGGGILITGAKVILFGVSSPEAISVLLQWAGFREVFRIYELHAAGDRKALQGSFVSTTAAFCFLTAQNVVEFTMAYGKEGIAGAAEPGVAFLIDSAGIAFSKNRSGMTWRELYKFYRDYLFDRDDKGPPPGRPRILDRLSEKTRALLGGPTPKPAG